jgi:hypothetical protein
MIPAKKGAGNQTRPNRSKFKNNNALTKVIISSENSSVKQLFAGYKFEFQTRRPMWESERKSRRNLFRISVGESFWQTTTGRLTVYGRACSASP